MPDIRQRFYFANSPVRGEIVQIQQSLEQILSRHAYPIVIQRLLGEFVTACVLLTATLKLEGRLSLQARGKGALTMMMAECNHHHQVRAIAQLNEEIDCADHATLAELLAEGLLVITLEPEHGQRYQGIVELTGKTLADYLENYFKQSEQLPTKLWLAANETQAAGLLLQALPQQHDEDTDRWSRLVQVTQTVKAEELLALTSDEILYRLYHEEEVTLPEAQSVSFSCTCSREGTANALVSIGQAECEDILAEQGDIRLNCQFCHHEYVFNAADIRQLFAVKLH
ncbi:MAG: Hsp33 family molecular chaperone HslO [Moraxellaceae bacterium]|nr:Hsp33 family molecular chaperone HslO [Pseudomonadales bacterium]MCB1673031.1 Hsp33 family molecular chaperone HslO [Pseudomonadales bacterium]MCP5175535.1 Hsp33 family molecular chaperone HslO [Moraxellaceae bacterium]HQV21738.1 Hsp33 family molecular chaperone HslO [Agitococcus sp.]